MSGVNDFKVVFEDRFQGWDDVILEGFGWPHPLQSSAFADYAYEFSIFGKGMATPKTALVYRDSQLVAATLFFVSSKKLVTIMYGPMIRSDLRSCRRDIVNSLYQGFAEVGFLGVASHRSEIVYQQDGNSTAKDLDPGFKSQSTLVVDLHPTLEALNSGFHHSVRKNVKKCLAQELECVQGTDDRSVAIYLEMLHWFRQSRGFGLPPLYPSKRAIEIFNRPHTSMTVSVVRQKNFQPLAGLGFISFGKIAFEIGVAQSPTYYEVNIPAHDLIKVKAIEYFKARALNFYDLAGGAVKDLSAKDAAIRKFKLKFSNFEVAYSERAQHYFSRHRQILSHVLSGARKAAHAARGLRSRLFSATSSIEKSAS